MTAAAGAAWAVKELWRLYLEAVAAGLPMADALEWAEREVLARYGVAVELPADTPLFEGA